MSQTPTSDPLSRQARARVTVERTLRIALSGRVMWGVLDQGLFGVTSFALSVGVANRATAEQFGAFGIAYVIYTLILGTVEGFTAEVVIVRGSHLSHVERHRMLASATGTAFCIGLLFAALGCAFLLFAHGTDSQVVPPLLLPAPFLFIQHVWRFGFFAVGRPRSAVVNDTLWAVLLAVGFVLAAGDGGATWITLVWCWSIAGAICGVVGAVQARCLPRPDTVSRWVRDQAQAGGRFAGEYLALYGAGQAVLIWVGVFAGLAASAGYRGATLLFGPIQVTLNAVRLAVTPLVVRARAAGAPNAAVRGGLTVTVCALAVTIAWGAAVLLLPSAVGERILGQSWNVTQPVLPVMLWLTMALSVALGAIVVLRVEGAYRETFRIRLAGAAGVFLCGGAGALGGAVTAGLGASLAATATAGALWWQAHRIGEEVRSPSLLHDRA